MLGAPILERGDIQVAALPKGPAAQEAFQGCFSFSKQYLLYRKNTVGLVSIFFSSLTALHPASSQGAWKCGCSSWRAHHPFDRSCHENSAHTPADVWVWNKSGSLAPCWLASVGLRGVESSKISFQSIKICRDIRNVQREQISRVNQSND